MPNFTAGTSFTDGVTNDVTAAKLNALIADAVPTSSLSLNSTTGTISQFSSGTGTAASPAIQPTGDTNTGIFFPAADTIAFSEGGTESMRIDSSGNVGIGTSSPVSKLDIRFSTNPSNDNGTGSNVLRIATSVSQGADIGGAIGLGGEGIGSVIFGQIAGRKENSNSSSNSGYLQFNTLNNNGTMLERLRIDSNGNVGIGTSSPTVKLDVNGESILRGSLNVRAIEVGTAGLSGNRYALIDFVGDDTYTDFGLRISRENTGANANSVILSRGTGSLILQTNEAGSINMLTNATERLRITSGGDLLVGTTTQSGKLTVENSANDEAGYFYVSNASQTVATIVSQIGRNTSNNSCYAYQYYNVSGAETRFLVADSGNVTNKNNSYGAISDIKNKQDIIDASSQWSDIKSLRVRKYRFKSDPSMPLQLGLIAQEAETVSAGLIDEHPDYEDVEITNEDGTITKERKATGTSTKAIKYSVLYMKAVKALQEAMERIEQLESKVAILEAA